MERKTLAQKEETFDKLELRLGRIIKVESASNTPKPSYFLHIDFGKFGVKTSVGRFTEHSPDDLTNGLVFAVLNFPPRQIGDHTSEVLVLGAQFPKAASGEATPISPLAGAKIGGKLF